ncbi:MAG: hypothetical protein JW940_03955, partial [Polyangiaceae bacterium]|nr:hypothetical protein [Polyangiaceae bacterium]
TGGGSTGTATGGVSTGGTATGGTATGGVSTGGISTGGISTGGTATGGIAGSGGVGGGRAGGGGFGMSGAAGSAGEEGGRAGGGTAGTSGAAGSAGEESGQAGGGGTAGTSGAAGAGGRPPRIVRPALAVMRYYDEAGELRMHVATSVFKDRGDCHADGIVCTQYDAAGLTLERQNEIQLFVDVGDDWPANEVCWFYDYNHSPKGFLDVHDPGCVHVITSDNRKWTGMSEWVALRNSPLGYWTAHNHTPPDSRAQYMAYLYSDDGPYGPLVHTWVGSTGQLISP